MSSTALIASPEAAEVAPKERLAVLIEELAELTGQRNAIDGRIVDIVAEIEHARLWGMTGVRSLKALVAWKAGVSPRNAHTIAAVAERIAEFPLCAKGLREGRLSLDQVGVIAERAADGSDAHYAQLAASAMVSQLRTAIKLAPQPQPKHQPQRSFTKTSDAQGSCWRIKLDRLDAATFDAALQSHLDALMAQWKHDHDERDAASDHAVPLPTTADAFMALVEAGWDAEAARRPHGQRTTVVVHLDVDKQSAGLHLGPLLLDDERRYLTCDAGFQAWFERDGQPIGAGRTTRGINRRLRRALEHRQPTCAVPGCGATRGLHAHHIRHWEDGGPTDLDNLVLVCPYHHRLHHRRRITITGDANHLTVTDHNGKPLSNASLARPPTKPPPAVPPYRGPTGERAQWWWYQPYEPQPPPATN